MDFSLKKGLSTMRRFKKTYPDDIHRAAGDFWGACHKEEGEHSAYWLAITEIKHRVNLRVSGRPEIWPVPWFLFSLPKDKLPVRRALSIGCGPGNLEREVLRLGGAMHMDAVDVSSDSLEVARRLANEQGFGDKVSYQLADAASWLKNENQDNPYDLIFFHASLHHIEALAEVLSHCSKSLAGGDPGLLFVDEYVGPSRDEWRSFHLGHAAELYARISPEFRKAEEIPLPVAFEDPTEMIRSSEICPVLSEYFEIIEYKPYYGNVVMPLVAGLKANALEDPETMAIIRSAMDLEDFLIEKDLLDPFYVVLIGKPVGLLSAKG
jgi:SAM-dependent methyltransferase